MYTVAPKRFWTPKLNLKCINVISLDTKYQRKWHLSLLGNLLDLSREGDSLG